MEILHKDRVSEALGNIKSAHYLAFARAVSELHAGMDGWERCRIIEAMAEIDFAGKILTESTPTFVHIVTALSAGMNVYLRCNIIGLVNKLDPEHYQKFLTNVIELSIGVGNEHRYAVIDLFAKVDPTNHEAFINAAKKLSIDTYGENRWRIISAVRLVHPTNYEPFVNIGASLFDGMDEKKRAVIISAVARFEQHILQDLWQAPVADVKAEALRVFAQKYRGYDEAAVALREAIARDEHEKAVQQVAGSADTASDAAPVSATVSVLPTAD
jgi:hypothetical protein